MSIAMFVVAVGSQTTVDSGYRAPHDGLAVLICIGAIVALLVVVGAAAAIANHRDSVREQRNQRPASQETPPSAV